MQEQEFQSDALDWSEKRYQVHEYQQLLFLRVVETILRTQREAIACTTNDSREAPDAQVRSSHRYKGLWN